MIDKSNTSLINILQLDGNISVVSSSSSELPNVSDTSVSACFFGLSQPVENSVPVIITRDRPDKILVPRQPSVRKTVRCESKNIQALSLPTIVSYNMRSIWSKIQSLADDLHEREADICFLCEVWEKSSNEVPGKN